MNIQNKIYLFKSKKKSPGKCFKIIYLKTVNEEDTQ